MNKGCSTEELDKEGVGSISVLFQTLNNGVPHYFANYTGSTVSERETKTALRNYTN